MHAQLLSTVPSHAIDIGDGHAANDDFEIQPTAMLAYPRAVTASEAAHVAANEDDDYWLGGYAGI